MTISSSSEAPKSLLRFDLKSDGNAVIGVRDLQDKMVDGRDAIEFLQRALPDVEKALSSTVAFTGSEIVFPRYVLCMREINLNTREVFFYREGSKQRLSIEMNYSSGGPLDVYSRLMENIKNILTAEALDKFMRDVYGGGFNEKGRAMVFGIVSYPSIVASMQMHKLEEKVSEGVLWGIRVMPKYRATSASRMEVLQTIRNKKSLLNLDTVPGQFNVPFPNFFEGGDMCFGTISKVDKFLDKGNYQALDWFMDVLNSSNYNFDLQTIGISTHYFEKANQGCSQEGLFIDSLIGYFPDKYKEIDEVCKASLRYVKQQMNVLNWLAYLCNVNSFPY